MAKAAQKEKSTMPIIRMVPIEQLKFDPNNANRGTARGESMLEDSMADFGIGRPVLADKYLELIAGNKSVQKAAEMGFTEAIIVPVNGKQMVVAQRMDVEAQSSVGRGLALADNTVALANIEFDPSMIEDCRKLGVELDKWFYESEIEELKVREIMDQGGNVELDAAVTPDGTKVMSQPDNSVKPEFVEHGPGITYEICPQCKQKLPPK